MAGMKLIATLIGRDASYGKTLKTAKANTIDFGRTLATVGTKMAALFAVRSVFQFGKQVADVTRTYEDSLARIGAISQATADEMMEIDSTLKRIGQTSRVTAREAASGMQFLVMAGLDANEAIAALQPTMNLAKGAGVSMAQSADMVTNLLSGLGLEADKTGQLVDVMAHAFRTANTDIPQFYAALKPMSPIINQLGLEVDDATVAINMLANAGIQGAEAGTSLRMAISRLIRQPGEAAKALDKLGVTINESTIKNDGLIGTFEKLKNSGANVVDLAHIFGRHFTRIGVLVNATSEDLRAMEAEVAKNVGAAEELRNAVSPLTRETEMLKASWEDLLIALGQSGVNDFAAQFVKGTRLIVGEIRSAIDGFKNMSSEAKIQMSAIGAIVMAAVTVATGGIALLVAGIVAAILNFERLQYEADVMSRNIAKSIETIKISVGSDWDYIKERTKFVWDYIAEKITGSVKTIWTAIKGGNIKESWKETNDKIAKLTSDHAEAVVKINKDKQDKLSDLDNKYLTMSWKEYQHYLKLIEGEQDKSNNTLYESLRGALGSREDLNDESLEGLANALVKYYEDIEKIAKRGEEEFAKRFIGYRKLLQQQAEDDLSTPFSEDFNINPKIKTIDLSGLDSEEIAEEILSPYQQLEKKLVKLKTLQKAAWQVDPEQYKQATEGIAQIEAQMETFGEQTEDMTRKQKALFDVVRQTSQAFVGMGEAMGEQDFSKVREQLYSLVQQLIATAMAALLAKETVKFGLVGLLAAGAFGLAFLKGTMGKTREQSFAYGGVVQGNSRSGDRTLVRANAGEMILNQGQQQRLFNAMNGGMFGMMGMDWRIRGEDLVLSTSRANKTIKRRNG